MMHDDVNPVKMEEVLVPLRMAVREQVSCLTR